MLILIQPLLAELDCYGTPVEKCTINFRSSSSSIIAFKFIDYMCRFIPVRTILHGDFKYYSNYECGRLSTAFRVLHPQPMTLQKFHGLVVSKFIDGPLLIAEILVVILSPLSQTNCA